MLTIGTAIIVACEEADTYVFSARRYDPDAACLDSYKPIEVVPGSSVSSTCPLHCLQVGPDTYVTTVCPPLPSNAVAVELDAEACVIALEAGLCESELEETDASTAEEDAGEDAEASSPDAGIDADDGAATAADAGDAD